MQVLCCKARLGMRQILNIMESNVVLNRGDGLGGVKPAI
jgi:hypothetical protein